VVQYGYHTLKIPNGFGAGSPDVWARELGWQVEGIGMPIKLNADYILPVIMLAASNLFMTFAWYGHLSFKQKPLWIVVLVSWAIAFFEYWLAVPANRIGSSVYSAAELKTIQEVITFCIFIGFAVFYLGEKITLQHVVGFAVIIAGAGIVFRA
jgi:uncharacterized protein